MRSIDEKWSKKTVHDEMGFNNGCPSKVLGVLILKYVGMSTQDA